MRRRTRGLVCVFALIAGAGIRAARATPVGPAEARSPSPSSSTNQLLGVSAVSHADAWAVGSYLSNKTGPGRTLILHWNGTRWSKLRSPNPSSISDFLNGVSAISDTDAWAVGALKAQPHGATVARTLVVRWNGVRWSKVASPNASTSDNDLEGVSAVSARNAWAVGEYVGGSTGTERTLILHWNGTRWSKVKSPNASMSVNELRRVSAVSAGNAWAVGHYCASGCAGGFPIEHTLILHWNGSRWSKVASPSPSSTFDELEDVTALSATNAWAVGAYADDKTSVAKTLILHWDGTGWSKVASPNPSSVDNGLLGASAVSATNVWAVGESDADTHSLILHWDGTRWSKVASPDPSKGDNVLFGVSGLPSDAWAVGYYLNDTTGAYDTLALYWDGSSWSKT